MGLPSFLKFIAQRHAACIRQALPQTCHRLYIDFNGLIHNAVHRCEAPVTNDGVIAKVIAMTRELVDDVKPVQSVMLAVDGVPVFSKMIQQRQRRFMSAWKRRQLGEEDHWNSNAITPGTTFMTQLSQSLHEFVAAQNATSELVWTLSDASEPSEGEVKIFRALKADHLAVPHGVAVIHGADADLIIRAMLHMALCKGPNVYIMREPTMFIDIDRFRQQIWSAMHNGDAGVLDYVLLMELVGNDFVPCLSYLSHKAFAVPFLVALYREVIAKQRRRLWTLEPDGVPLVHWDVFGTLLHAIAGQEDARFPTSHDQFMSMVPHRRMTPAQRLDNIGLFVKEPRDFDAHSPNWRYAYDRLLLGFPDPRGEDRFRACAPYLQGLEWMLRYYVCLDAPTGWGYPYGYSPTAMDLSMFLQMKLDRGELQDVLHGMNVEFVSDDPVFQLCVVLPPQSAELLPRPLQRLMNDPSLGCVAYYPWNFQIWTYLKHYSWEVFPRLPELNIPLLLSRFKALQSTAAP